MNCLMLKSHNSHNYYFFTKTITHKIKIIWVIVKTLIFKLYNQLVYVIITSLIPFKIIICIFIFNNRV